MLYNYFLEVGAVFFMIVILIHFLTSRQFPVLQTRLFFFFLIFSIIECLVDIASCIAIAHVQQMPAWIAEVTVFLYFFIQVVTYYIFYLYTVAICDLPRADSKKYCILGLVPMAVELLIVMSAPINGYLYYFDSQYRYFSGKGRSISYLCILAILLLGVALSYKYKLQLRKNYKIIIGTYSVICGVSLFIQYYFPENIVLGLGRACTVLLIYISMQNMGEYKDSTIGIYNFAAFPIMFSAIQKKNYKFAMISLELEKYYKMAMELGNRNAAVLLQDIAEEIYKLGKKYHVFRMGYGLFTILAEDDQDKVEYIVNTLRGLLQKVWVIDGRNVYLNGNVVVQYYPEQFSSAVEGTSFTTYLLEKASVLGNNVNLYADSELVADFKRNADVEQALDYAIKKGLLEVYYQPIYSVEENKITSAEALVRLFDKNLGFLPPSEFIPIAEKNGRIIALGNLVLEKSCRFIKEKLLCNPDNQIGEIHINISAIQCMQPDMSDQIIQIIDKYQVPPEMIYLEVTEQATMSATLLMREHMKKLGERGVRFALDDYGTGNSNCSYLIDFSFQKVKFDRFMMQAYFEKDDARVILQNEIGTLKKLGISVVVEGIETWEQVEEMEHQMVDYIQGYYYAKPMPGIEFLEFLEKWQRQQEEAKRMIPDVLTL